MTEKIMLDGKVYTLAQDAYLVDVTETSVIMKAAAVDQEGADCTVTWTFDKPAFEYELDQFDYEKDFEVRKLD